MAEAVIIVGGLVVVGFAAYLIAGAPKRAARKAFAQLPLTAIGAVAAPGRYRLSGIATALGDPPVSEASGRPYLVRELWVRPNDGSGSGSARTGQQFVDFLLDDGTGTVVVHADGGIVVIDRDFDAPKTTLDQVPWVDAFLRDNGYHNGSPGSCKITLSEGVLEPGTQIGVVGFVAPADVATGAPALVCSQGRTTIMIRPEPVV